ncbi:YdcF family protein [Luteimonas sp. e5]
MGSRTAHRLRLALDRDVLHVAAVALTVCTLSAGLVYVAYFAHVLRIARRADCQPQEARCLLLFGKHAPGGRMDADFTARIERASLVWTQHAPERMFLLGGGPADAPSEAELAREALRLRVTLDESRLHLERESRDTLQNLRNARALLQQAAHRGPVLLLSSRYHLARCALFARQLGLQAELCAAEPHLPCNARTLLRLIGEAGYVCLADVGARWARLIGSRRMLARLK